MSGRCKACNAFMSDEDMCRKFPPDEAGNREYSDMCGSCHEEALAIMYHNYVDPTYYDWVFAHEFTLRETYTMSEVSE